MSQGAAAAALDRLIADQYQKLFSGTRGIMPPELDGEVHIGTADVHKWAAKYISKAGLSVRLHTVRVGRLDPMKSAK